MGFYAQYPANSSGMTSNPSVGVNTAPAPSSSTQVGGQDPSGNLQPLQVDANGNLLVSQDPSIVQHVIVDSSALPAGASTSALQTAGNASLTSIDTQLNSQATATKQDTQTALLTTIDAELLVIDASINTLLKPADTLAKVSEVTSILNPLPAGTNVIGHVIVDSSDLPTGAATAANQTNGSQKSQIVSAAGEVVDVVELSNQLVDTESGLVAHALISGVSTADDTLIRIKVEPDGKVTAEVTGTVTANAGTNLNTSALNLEATQSAMSAKLPATLGQKAMAASMAVVIASDQSAVPVSFAANQSVNVAQINGVTVSTGAGPTGTGVQRVIESNVAAATTANVSSLNTNQTLLASNASRRGASFYNESTENCLVKFGATASATSYTVRMTPLSYYELPQPVYSGVIDGIWDATAGAMRVTEW